MGGQLVDCSLKEFLWQHVELVLTKKGFDDSVGRNPQPSHFELPTYTKWVQVASRLHQVLISNTDEDVAELATKVQSQVKVLEGFLDADTKFSENRCQKALPLAHSAYQSNLPHNYTTTVHKNQLAQALRVYSQHARGVAFQRYALQLHEDCYKFWSNGHQLCEERSLTDQHCVHKFHLLPQPGERHSPLYVISSENMHLEKRSVIFIISLFCLKNFKPKKKDVSCRCLVLSGQQSEDIQTAAVSYKQSSDIIRQ